MPVKQKLILKDKQMEDIHATAVQQCEEFDELLACVRAVGKKHAKRRSNNKGSLPATD